MIFHNNSIVEGSENIDSKGDTHIIRNNETNETIQVEEQVPEYLK